jgi:hypothetical protein
MTIWGKYQGKIEAIDHCGKRECAYLVREYQLAYGKQRVIWAGKKTDEPGMLP